MTATIGTTLFRSASGRAFCYTGDAPSGCPLLFSPDGQNFYETLVRAIRKRRGPATVLTFEEQVTGTEGVLDLASGTVFYDDEVYAPAGEAPDSIRILPVPGPRTPRFLFAVGDSGRILYASGATGSSTIASLKVFVGMDGRFTELGVANITLLGGTLAAVSVGDGSSIRLSSIDDDPDFVPSWNGFALVPLTLGDYAITETADRLEITRK